MAFQLGSFSIDEILYAVAEDFDGNILYSLDQLSSASIEISSESNDVTDKNGNIIRTIYRSKTGTFTATNALLHPQVLNAASGTAIEQASAEAAIVMPRIQLMSAGAVVQIPDADDDSISVIGIYGSGANSEALTKGTAANFATLKFGYDNDTNTITLPAAGVDQPVNYLVKYNRNVTSGFKLSNYANAYPKTCVLTLFCSYVDPCDDEPKACYVVLPSFQASPETTLSLDVENTEIDFTGNLQISYCESNPALYYIYFPDENVVKTAIAA